MNTTMNIKLISSLLFGITSVLLWSQSSNAATLNGSYLFNLNVFCPAAGQYTYSNAATGQATVTTANAVTAVTPFSTTVSNQKVLNDIKTASGKFITGISVAKSPFLSELSPLTSGSGLTGTYNNSYTSLTGILTITGSTFNLTGTKNRVSVINVSDNLSSSGPGSSYSQKLGEAPSFSTVNFSGSFTVTANTVAFTTPSGTTSFKFYAAPTSSSTAVLNGLALYGNSDSCVESGTLIKQ